MIQKPKLVEGEELELIDWILDCIADDGYLDMSMSDPSGEEEIALSYLYHLLKQRETELKEG